MYPVKRAPLILVHDAKILRQKGQKNWRRTTSVDGGAIKASLASISLREVQLRHGFSRSKIEGPKQKSK